MNKNLKFHLLPLILICGLLFEGCQTLKMPAGPDVSSLPHIQNAPTIGIQVIDSRSSERIGTIGAASLYVKANEIIPPTQNYLIHFLYEQGINAVVMPQSVNLPDLNLDGLINMDVKNINVSSFDLLMDEPEYISTALVTLTDQKGQTLFKGQVQGNDRSRAISVKGTGIIIGKTINNAIMHLSISNEFMKAIKNLKH